MLIVSPYRGWAAFAVPVGVAWLDSSKPRCGAVKF